MSFRLLIAPKSTVGKPHECASNTGLLAVEVATTWFASLEVHVLTVPSAFTERVEASAASSQKHALSRMAGTGSSVFIAEETTVPPR